MVLSYVPWVGFVGEAAGSRRSSRLEGGAPGFGAPASCRLDERLPAARTVESEPRSRPSSNRGERLFAASHRGRPRSRNVTLGMVFVGPVALRVVERRRRAGGAGVVW